MNFFKTFLACLLAILLSSVLSVCFSILVLVGMMSVMLAGETDMSYEKQNAILHITLNTQLRESVVENPLDDIDFSSMSIKGSMTVLQAVEAIDQAASDPNIKGIYLDMPLAARASTDALYQLRDAITRFKESSQKFVVAYGDYYSQGTFWLASTADKVYLNPEGGLHWAGLAMNAMFYKQTLEKLGVEPEIFRHGKFKGAVEPLLLEKLSAENRLQMTQLSNSIWNTLVQDIAHARKIDSADLQKYASELTISSPRQAAKLTMVDSLAYREHVLAQLAILTQANQEKPNLVSIEKYAATYQTTKKYEKNKIAIVYADGDIVDHGSGKAQIVGNKLRETLAEVRRNKNIKAVVLRVNSPGGSVLASDIIHHAVELLKAEKPVVVSMGDYAASGGYYISCPADEIIAAPTTITGSIGVFGMWFNVANGAQKWLGITTDAVTTNTSADLGNIFRPMSAAEKQFMQNGVDSTYNRFVGLVASGRLMGFEEVDSIAEGRVWSGAQAVKIGLVDRLGTLSDAVLSAAEKAGVDNYSVTTYPKQDPNSFAALLSSSFSAAIKYIGSSSDPVKVARRQLETLKTKQGVRAQIPYDICIEGFN